MSRFVLNTMVGVVIMGVVCGEKGFGGGILAVQYLETFWERNNQRYAIILVYKFQYFFLQV